MSSFAKPLFLCVIGALAALPGVWQPSLGAQEHGVIAITQLSDADDEIAFTFTSTWPAGTSYQLQFLRSLGDSWTDVPDAHVEPVAPGGTFRATAPKFGGVSGFYRVAVSVSVTNDPVASTLGERDPEEILLIWNQPLQGATTNTVSGKLYYHVAPPPGGSLTNTLRAYPTNGPPFDFGPALPVADFGPHDMLLADLTGDGRADPLLVWANPGGTITLTFVEISPTNFNWQISATFDLSTFLVRPFDTVPPLLRLAAVRIDDDPNPEVVLAYTGLDGFVHIAVLEFSADLSTVRVEAEIATAALPFVSSGSLRDRSARFDIAAGDFDGDGFDEVALVATEAITVPNGIQNWQLYVRFYDYDAGAARFVPDTIPHASAVLYTHGDRTTRWLSRVAAHAADFDGDGRDELAAAYHVGFTDATSFWYLQLVKPSANFTSITLNLAQRLQVDSSTGNSGFPLSLLSGEFDGDPEPELVLGAKQLFLINVQTNLSASIIGQGNTAAEANYDDRRFMALAQLDSRDPNTGFIPEIVLVLDTQISGGSQRRFLVRTFKATPGVGGFFNLAQDAILNDSVSNNRQRYCAVGAGDFGGNGTKLGTPRRYTRTVAGKPTVIVNAPPVHFDILGGTTFDVNGLFPVGACASSGTCPFYSRYAGVASRGVTVETRWERGWDFSATVSGGFTVPILEVGVDVEVQTKFGQRLDSYASQFETTRVEVQVDAVGDDRIYAATVDYTVWEYPVLVDGGTFGHIVVVDPSVTSQNWFGSKSIVALNYRPHHEVGNVLSYRSTTEPYAGAEYVRNIISADTFTVDSSSSYIWRLTRTTGQTTTESKTFNFSIRGSASFDIPYPFIPNVELEGGYDTSTLNASTSTITDEQGLATFLGNLDGTIAGTAYSITPYVYWDRSGAVVLDYAVNLPAGTPSIPTFWGQRYGQKSDPAFILPWRLDPEKGDNLTDPSLRQLTREIMTLPPEPRPGEAVNLVARVSNFSFLATTSTFKLRFYLGDPAMGGQLITGTDGRSEIVVPAGIAARGKQLVQLPWRIPASASSVSLEIYAVIDADNQIDEIHEDNNVGWNEVFLRHGP